MDTTVYGPGEYLPPDAMTVDHVFPKSRGGSDDASNKVLACLSCNKNKGSKTLLELEMA